MPLDNREAFAWLYQWAAANNASESILDNLSALAKGYPAPHKWRYPAMPDEPAAVAPPNSQFQDHVKHVQEFLQQMFAIMIDPVEDATGTVADTCRLLLNAARRDRETINHLMSPKVAPPTRPAGLDVEALLELCEKATPGPWTTHKMEGHTAVAANTLIARVFSTAFKDLENERVNAHLISAARTALPLALQHILALEREIARLRADGERR